MAIKDMKGTVTTTGMMNEKPVAKAPDMSGMKMSKGPVLPPDPTTPVNPFNLNQQDQFYQKKKVY